MLPSSKLIPPSLCELEDFSDIDSNLYSNGNIDMRKNEEFLYTIHNSEEQDISDVKGYTHINIRINGPEYYDERPYERERRGSEVPMDGYNSINEHTTGYSNFKECFSQEDILEAFKSIDLNKDGQIDASDIRLFLDYMEESYSQDEVSEMIAMLNETDCHTVGYDEFRRLASGEIIGLTTYPTGDKERLKIQSRILSNMENTRLKHTLLPTNSYALVGKLKKDRTSLERKGKSQPKGESTSRQPEIYSDSKGLKPDLAELPLFNKKFRQYKQQLFQQYVRLDYYSVRQNCCGMDSKPLTAKQIGRILELPETDARRLYPQEKTPLRQVLLEALSFSFLTKQYKLQEALIIFSSKKTISFEYMVRLLSFLQTQEDNPSSKLGLLYRKRGLSVEGELSKYTVLSMLNDYTAVFHV